MRPAFPHLRRVPRAVAAVLVLLALPACQTPSSTASLENSTAGRAAATPLAYPAARRGDVVDTYHGVEVTDPYRWLEDLESAATRGWMDAQAELLESYLDPVVQRAASADRIHAIGSFARRSVPIRRGMRSFFVAAPAGSAQGRLMTAEANGAPRRLFDPETQLDATRWTFGGAFAVSPRGDRVALRLNPVGPGFAAVRIVDVESGHLLDETLIEVLGGLSWSGDGRGLFYTRYRIQEEGSIRTAELDLPRIYFHVAGTTQDADTLVFERPDRPRWRLAHRVTSDGRFLVISAAEGSSFTGLQDQIWVRDLDDPEAELVALFDHEPDGRFAYEGNDGQRFWFRTTHAAPRGRLIAVELDRPEPEHWQELVAERDATLNAVSAYDQRLVLRYSRDARPFVEITDWAGQRLKTPDLPNIGLLGGFNDDLERRQALFTSTALYDSGTLYRLDLDSGKVGVYWRPELAHDPDAFEMRQVFYSSPDGTRVPMFVAGRRGALDDGPRPLFLYGYGVLGWSALPWFQPHVIEWMERGGLYALPGIRGGGEYGEGWHRAAIKTRKQTTIDDYLSAAEKLVSEGLTTSELLVANGGSASAVIAAAAMQQRPDLFAAAVVDIPRLDMLRYHLFTGARYVIPEFGSADDPEEFRALHAYSPYHNVDPGRCYPPTLAMVGENDLTAPPLHGYKLIAEMQARSPCASPALLKIMWGAGHTYGTTPRQSAESWADAWAFVQRALGAGAFRPTAG